MFNINFFNFFTKFWEKLNLDIEKNVVIQTRNINKTGLFSFGVLRSRNFRHSKKSAAGQMAGTRVWNSTSSRHLAYQPKLRGSVENILPCVFALSKFFYWIFINKTNDFLNKDWRQPLLCIFDENSLTSFTSSGRGLLF